MFNDLMENIEWFFNLHDKDKGGFPMKAKALTLSESLFFNLRPTRLNMVTRYFPNMKMAHFLKSDQISHILISQPDEIFLRNASLLGGRLGNLRLQCFESPKHANHCLHHLRDIQSQGQVSRRTRPRRARQRTHLRLTFNVDTYDFLHIEPVKQFS